MIEDIDAINAYRVLSWHIAGVAAAPARERGRDGCRNPGGTGDGLKFGVQRRVVTRRKF